ncbi:hypothetical protein [uncultured Thiothrix sp.]|uniref:hypothetical protein n=1 Tax=uncultured Thiothrix sp. TaxID=223185 RepID=UPI00262657FF|nr:hypothetical protein [uncultured Thiothrix sp.]
MKKLLIALSLFGLASSASADFFGSGNNGEWKMGPYGPYWEENDWPEWTPMYWMQEMSDSFNNDNTNGFNFNQGFSSWNMPFFGNNNYGNGMPMMPYGYPTAAMMPYGAMPMPYYGAGYAMPNLPVMPSAPVNTAPGPSTPTEATGTTATN